MKVKIPKVFMESETENNKIGSSYHEIQTIYSLWHPEWGEILMNPEIYNEYFNRITQKERERCVVKRGEVTWTSWERKGPPFTKSGE